jgi:hypothetical protein
MQMTKNPQTHMKNVIRRESSSRALRAASSKFILTGLIVVGATVALPSSSHAQISNQPFTLDGKFTDGFTPVAPLGEWSDVTPVSFISSSGGTVPTTNTNPLRNTQLYAAISHNVASSPGDLQLHLMYDFLPRTTLPQLNEIFASVTFPVTLQGRPKDNISVVFRGNGNAGPNFFDIFVDLDVNNPSNPLAPLNAGPFPGLLGSVSLAGSPLSPVPHLLVELEVPLRIAPSQVTPGGPLPGGGINPATGMYDPDPVFWGAAAGAGDSIATLTGGKGGASLGGGLQDATSVIIGINGDGSLSITPTPEPSSAILLIGSLAILGARRRK